MKIIKSNKELEALNSKKLAFVPTMGNLHAGHLKLVSEAKKLEYEVIVSIFVNPLQFGKDEDFDSYPKTLKEDKLKLISKECDYLFLPKSKELLNGIHQETSRYNNFLCGIDRPEHFNGVASIIRKFLEIIKPNSIIMGEKDFQQTLVIKELIIKHNFKCKLITIPTARENSGLAMSSRNNYLTETERMQAAKIYSTLVDTKNLIFKNGFNRKDLKNKIIYLKKNNINVIYFDLFDAESLESINESPHLKGNFVLATAAKIGNTRLIDNIVFSI